MNAHQENQSSSIWRFRINHATNITNTLKTFSGHLIALILEHFYVQMKCL